MFESETLNGLCCVGTSKYHFSRCVAAERAAAVLGVNLQTLSDSIFSPADVTHSTSAIDRLENFVSVLYSQLLQSLNYLMNRFVHVDFILCSISFPAALCYFLKIKKL